MRAVEQRVDLLCHPSNSPGPVRRIAAVVSRSHTELRLTFHLDGDLTRLRVPAPRPPAVAHRLWEHTCFEAFVATEGRSAYHELNVSPSGEWAVYVFSSYREIAGLGDATPEVEVRPAGERLELRVRLALAQLAGEYPRAALRVGLSAVVEDVDGGHSYWALRHPADRPDFHHAASLALRLERCGPGW